MFRRGAFFTPGDLDRLLECHEHRLYHACLGLFMVWRLSSSMGMVVSLFTVSPDPHVSLF
jgi:hypothetical protein